MGTSDVSSALLPFEPTPAAPYGRAQAAHLLDRTGFGGTPEEIAAVLKLGPARAAEKLLDFPDATAAEQDARDLPDLSATLDYPSQFDALAKRFAGLDEREARILRGQIIDAHRAALLNLIGWWIRRMARGKHPLQEKLTLCWHGHFTTSSYDVFSTPMLWQQHELLRRHAAGDFAALLDGVCHDPAMLQYLDNATSQKAAPNENFARELLELFTLGIGHYTEADIRGIARAFTGWSHDGEKFVFRAADHDTGRKTIFGQTGEYDGGEVVRLILARPQCATFIATRIFQYFVSPDVPPELAANLGRTFADAKLNVRSLLRTILTSRAFYSDEAMGTQIKSPVHLMAGTIRLLDLPMPKPEVLHDHLASMGQVPFLPPDVKGWPSGRAWINTSTLFCRQNAASWLAGKMKTTEASQKPWPAQVDEWLARLIRQPISPEKRDALLRLPSQERDAMVKLVQLIVSLPEYQMT